MTKTQIKILAIEDEIEIRKYLKSIIESVEFKFIDAPDAKTAVSLIASQSPDLILLDLGLPDKDGQEFICEIREWCKTPIIVLSARDNDIEKVKALENGADDYVTKPFSADELLARIKVGLRHSLQSANDENHTFEFDGFLIDYVARTVKLDGIEISLTPIEYKILLKLTQNAGKVITHSQLLNFVWGKRAASDNTYLRIHTQHLREKLKDNPINPKYIMTVPGIGYKFRS